MSAKPGIKVAPICLNPRFSTCFNFSTLEILITEKSKRIFDAGVKCYKASCKSKGRRTSASQS